MKTNFLRITALLFLSTLFFSCSDDNGGDDVDPPYINPVKTLLSPANGYSVELTSTTTDVVEFEWGKAEASSGVTPIYEVVFIKEGGDFNKPLSTVKTGNSGKDSKMNITHRQLDQIAESAGIAEGESATLSWSVNASSSSLKVIAAQSNKITLTRTKPFVVPTTLYITGEATESGTSVDNALEFTRLSSGKFEIFTKLNASQVYKITDSKSQSTLRYFHVKNGKIEDGDGESKVSKQAVYRITVDFNTGDVTFVEVNNFRLIFCINENMIVNLKYDGNGTWKSDVNLIFLPNEWWGKEDRYKFKMNVIENNVAKDIVWGTKIATDGRPDGQDSYYYMKESFDNDIWAAKWKLKGEYDKNYIVVTASLQGGKEYTHSFEEVPPINFDWGSIADQSTTTLANNFWNSSKNHFYNNIYNQMRPYDYWPEAHAIDVIIDAYERTGNAFYKQRIYDFHEGIKAKNGNRFWNDYYDDMAWHGLAHLRAFKATNDTRYEQSAADLWGWLVEGWTDDDGGGIPWNHQDNESGRGKGVPTNGPSTIIGIRRWVDYPAEIKDGKNNLEWAKRIYTWIREHRYEPETGRVFERKDDTGGDWTYNAGTFMGAAMEMYNVTGEQMYFDDAIKIADYGIENLSSNFYVLSDWAEQYNTEKDEDHDVNLFKAIFVRYFTRLIMHPDLPSDKKNKYIDFMEDSAKCLWTRATLVTESSTTLFGHRWWEYPKSDRAVQLRTQVSGCAIMEAMALLQKKGYLNR
ncbi:MAG: SusE domain-containing protein [Prevotella sp.]|jgi:predicted alpha-1,6-mannanase (GH76 family)|nr:SusE domain-containing protein [Prevotella sp.]